MNRFYLMPISHWNQEYFKFIHFNTLAKNFASLIKQFENYSQQYQ